MNIGDTVRIRLNRNSFVRSFDEKYSDLKYIVTAVDKKNITLDDGKTYSSRRLIKTEPVQIPERKKDKLTEAKEETKKKKKVRKEHLEIDNKEYTNIPKTRLRKWLKGIKTEE